MTSPRRLESNLAEFGYIKSNQTLMKTSLVKLIVDLGEQNTAESITHVVYDQAKRKKVDSDQICQFVKKRSYWK